MRFKHADCSFQREGKNTSFGLGDSEAFRNQERKNDSSERRSLLIHGPCESCVWERPKYSTERVSHVETQDSLNNPNANYSQDAEYNCWLHFKVYYGILCEHT